MDNSKIKRLNKIIRITNKILLQEKDDNTKLKNIIQENGIKEKFSSNEFNYFYSAYKETQNKFQQRQDIKSASEIKIRSRLTTNQALSNIYSPAKRRIMEKIYNHQPLTNTELKYYYRAIRPVNRAILNDNMREYVRIIENSKKLK